MTSAKLFEELDPLPPCPHFGPIYSTKITQPPLLLQNLDNPTPSPSLLTLFVNGSAVRTVKYLLTVTLKGMSRRIFSSVKRLKTNQDLIPANCAILKPVHGCLISSYLDHHALQSGRPVALAMIDSGKWAYCFIVPSPYVLSERAMHHMMWSRVRTAGGQTCAKSLPCCHSSKGLDCLRPRQPLGVERKGTLKYSS